jgi:hypothetical protein
VGQIQGLPLAQKRLSRSTALACARACVRVGVGVCACVCACVRARMRVCVHVFEQGGQVTTAI